MYNRYIPQNDGSYSKKSVQGRPQTKPSPPPPSPVKPNPELRKQTPPNQNGSKPTGFLRQLLPREFDTEDLLIVLLLLLMAGDNEDEKRNALLTLALYFFI